MTFWNDLISYISKINAPKAITATVPVKVTVVGQEGKMTELDLALIDFEKSPNQSDRNDEIRGIVLHHTGPGSFKGIVSWLVNPQSKVSAHYVLGAAAELTQLVNTSKAAWHAGKSKATLGGQIRDNLNNCTVGIEICNVGLLEKAADGKFYYEAGGQMKEWRGAAPVFGSITYPDGKVVEGWYVPYPDVQKDKLVALCKAIIKKYPIITKEEILTHFQIALPIGRKNDPFGLDVAEIIRKIFE